MTKTPQELIAGLRGRARFCSDRGEIKSPSAMNGAANALEAFLARESAFIDALARASEREAVLRNALDYARKHIQRAPFGLFGVIDAALAQKGAE